LFVAGKNVDGNWNSSDSGYNASDLFTAAASFSFKATCEKATKKTTGAGPERGGWAMVSQSTSSDLRDGQTTIHIHKKRPPVVCTMPSNISQYLNSLEGKQKRGLSKVDRNGIASTFAKFLFQFKKESNRRRKLGR
jgi:hypothetical protein